MASSSSYISDDFEENNPFAEPGTSKAPEPQVQTQPEPEDQDTQPQQAATSDDHNGNEGEVYNDEDGKEELRRLLPERFVKKHHIHLKLQAIEPNKTNNPILRFDVNVQGLPRYRQAHYKGVRRTFNEIVKFNKYLIISNLEVFVPVIPLSVTSFPHGGEEEKKQLMSEWQEWFDRITGNPILIRDEEFVYFVENDFGYSVINTNRKASVASGLVRKTLKQLTLPYDPYEDLAEFRPVAKSTYLICQKLNKLFEKNAKSEKQLSVYISELSTKLSGLSNFEIIHPGMRNMWEKLAKIMMIQSDLTLVQLINGMGLLGDGLLTFSNDFYEIKEALTNRYLIMRELLQAEAQTKAKHAQASKVKSKTSLDPIKVEEAIRSFEYSSKAEESLRLQVKRISGEMLYEKQEVIDHTDLKLRKMLKRYTLGKVEHHRKILKHLENIRLDVRIIDDNGGLSRLNRDNLSSLKHNLAQSQSNNGDSWSSRTFRSLSTDQSKKNSTADGAPEFTIKGVNAKNAASILGVATF